MKKYKDPLAINFKETTCTLLKGAAILIAIPLVLSVTKLTGGSE